MQLYLARESHAIDLLLNILGNEKEVFELRLEALKTMNIMVRSGKAVYRHLLDSCDFVNVLFRLSRNPNLEFVGEPNLLRLFTSMNRKNGSLIRFWQWCWPSPRRHRPFATVTISLPA